MIVRYAPPESALQEWKFRPGEMESLEAEAIEEATGWAYYEFGQRILNGSAKAQRAILWTMLRRDDPNLRFADVSYRQCDLFVGYEPDEVAALRAALANPETLMPDDQRAALLEAMDLAIHEDELEVTDAGEATPPKARPAGRRGKGTAQPAATVSGT